MSNLLFLPELTALYDLLQTFSHLQFVIAKYLTVVSNAKGLLFTMYFLIHNKQ